MGARHIKPSELIAVNDLLKKHLKRVKTDKDPTGEGPMTDDTLVEYDRGFDDEQIAKMVAGDLSHASVARLRTELHGKLFVRGNSVEARLTSIEEWQINHLQGHVGDHVQGDVAELTARFNKLVETLALNKVADVRHLKVKADGVA